MRNAKRLHRSLSDALHAVGEVTTALDLAELSEHKALGHMIENILSAKAANLVMDEIVDSLRDGLPGYIRGVVAPGDVDFGAIAPEERKRLVHEAVARIVRGDDPICIFLNFACTTLAFHADVSDGRDHSAEGADLARRIIGDGEAIAAEALDW